MNKRVRPKVKPPEFRPTRLRLLSYNIHQGLNLQKRQLAFSLLKEAIKSLDADVVILQEVAGIARQGTRTQSDPGVSASQLEELADSIWPHYAYQKNALFTGGFHGNAILSRYPVVRSHLLDITVRPLDRRGLLHGEIEIPETGTLLHAMAIHLGLLQFERRRQLSKVVDYIHKKIPDGNPCFLAGDFNDWRQLVSSKIQKKLGMEEAFRKQDRKHARTFPSALPILSLDRIYYKGKGVKLHRAKRLGGKPWRYLSDHLPVMADFHLN